MKSATSLLHSTHSVNAVFALDFFFELSLRSDAFFYRLKTMNRLTQKELVRLTPPERLTLISQLWDSLEADELPLTAVQQAELDHRLDTLDQDRREGITWEALKSELEQRCS